MKATQITLVLLLAFLSYPCHSQFAPESLGDALSKDIVNRERLAWEAAKNKDKAGLAALLSEDFTEITEDGVFDKTQILANLDHLTVTSYSPRNIRLKKLSPDAVMLIFQVTVQGNYDDHNFHADSNATSLWMHRGSKWLDVHFQESPVPTSDSQDARIVDEQAIRAADAAWLKAVQVRDVDRIVSFYADDASEFPIAEPIATGKDAIRKNWEHMLGIPALDLAWQITKVEVSRSGDLAYVQSTYEASFENPQAGKPAIEKGKAVTVWKKEGDTWKAFADISNTDAPPPAHKESQAVHPH
jgi:ketosteroid isomerase-like protein